ncbi:hypothetical protein L2E82_00535 [Cichorium intybus]|uniref:Uncharacterized protein n=1 Tax=Cichorium intybus TaxID=13427 RepID=A0ACB9GXP0_CICIN|nr:hypothetical protein L2E82_00535 [Cichorium intybus]
MPGYGSCYQDKGVCCVGLLALTEGHNGNLSTDDNLSSSELTIKEKRVKMNDHIEDMEFSYDINSLDKDRDHYNSLWSTSNCIGQRELRDWLWKLWIGKPELRDSIRKDCVIAWTDEKPDFPKLISLNLMLAFSIKNP